MKLEKYFYFVYASAASLAAFLLFLIQPMIGRYILPWFGGGPIVWSIALVFFQTFLLFGYAYAHLLSQHSVKKQLIIHSAILFLSLLILPIIPSDSLKPNPAENPIIQILIVLVLTIGLPYFLLASTTPLIQSWFEKIQNKRSPYPLYSLSNTASIVALVSYPVFFEPIFGLTSQAYLWSGAFVILAVLIIFCLFYFLKLSNQINYTVSSHTKNSPPKKRFLLYWMGLTAIGSLMLVAVSHQMTSEIAPVPFLWIIPLVLYLLTFVLTFHSALIYSRKVFLLFFLVLLTVFSQVVKFDGLYSIIFQIVFYSCLLFVVCMICHGELSLSKPDKKYLTSFYLMMSIGGALGGIFGAIIAPALFVSNIELQIATFLTLSILLFIVFKNKALKFTKISPFAAKALILAYSALLIIQFSYHSFQLIAASDFITRNIYGVLRVQTQGDLKTFSHGSTVHGSQIISEETLQPTAYYGYKSGIGKAIARYPDSQPLKIGVIGLGVGTISALADENDYVRYYEIDRDVKKIAEDHFQYLSSSQGAYDIVIGDARISLENEQPQNFDIIVLDAFSSDAVPTHLLTSEAFKLYQNHLQNNGTIAVHISNRHLHLLPVIQTQAQDLGLWSWYISEPPENYNYKLEWIVLHKSRDAFAGDPIALTENWKNQSKKYRLWTDDYSNLLQVLKI
jgi:hypothetical protein